MLKYRIPAYALGAGIISIVLIHRPPLWLATFLGVMIGALTEFIAQWLFWRNL